MNIGLPRSLRSTHAVAAGLLLWSIATISEPALAAPAVSLSPAAGPPTTTVNVSGTGFSASALVDIYFDTTDLCLTIAGGTGNIRCVIQIPKDAQPQTHWISAVQRSTSIGAQKSITVRTDWAQFHGRDAKHTGFNPFENTLNTSNVANLDTLAALEERIGIRVPGWSVRRIDMDDVSTLIRKHDGSQRSSNVLAEVDHA